MLMDTIEAKPTITDQHATTPTTASNEPTPTKPALPPERLEKLAAARARAAEVRRARAAEKQRAKELRDKEYELLRAQNDAKEAALQSQAPPPAPEPAAKPAPEPAPAPAKPRRVRKVVLEESSSSDSEVEYVITKRPKKGKSKAEEPSGALAVPYAAIDPYAQAQREVRRDVGVWAASNVRAQIDSIKRDMLLKQLGGGV